MPLLNITADLTRTASALERIANALELLLWIEVNPASKPGMARDWPLSLAQRPKPTARRTPAGPEAVTAPTDEELWEAEQEQERLAKLGEPPETPPPPKTTG